MMPGEIPTMPEWWACPQGTGTKLHYFSNWATLCGNLRWFSRDGKKFSKESPDQERNCRTCDRILAH